MVVQIANFCTTKLQFIKTRFQQASGRTFVICWKCGISIVVVCCEVSAWWIYNRIPWESRIWKRSSLIFNELRFSFDIIIPRKYHRVFRTTFQEVSRRPFSRRLSYHPRPLSNHRPSFATTTFSVPPQRRRVTLSGASLQIQSATTRSDAPHRQRGKCQTLRQRPKSGCGAELQKCLS